MAKQIDQSFRDTIGTIDSNSGNRNIIHPKKPKGKFYNYKTCLLAFFDE